jgi:hypothetical protein
MVTKLNVEPKMAHKIAALPANHESKGVKINSISVPFWTQTESFGSDMFLNITNYQEKIMEILWNECMHSLQYHS